MLSLFTVAFVFIGLGGERLQLYVEDQSDLYPGVRNQVNCIQVLCQKPPPWSIHRFMSIPVQPGSPPAEGAVGRDVLSARTH